MGTRSRSTRCSTTPTLPRSPSSARRRSPPTSTLARRRSASGCRRSGGGKNHPGWVQALGGAKNHAVVMPGADLGYAADQLSAAGFGSAGQRCMAISVAVAVGESGAALVEEVASRARGIKVGPGLDPGSEMGPVVTPQARERIVDYIGQGAEAGARLTVDGGERGLEGGGFG